MQALSGTEAVSAAAGRVWAAGKLQPTPTTIDAGYTPADAPDLDTLGEDHAQDFLERLAARNAAPATRLLATTPNAASVQRAALRLPEKRSRPDAPTSTPPTSGPRFLRDLRRPSPATLAATGNAPEFLPPERLSSCPQAGNARGSTYAVRRTLGR